MSWAPRAQTRVPGGGHSFQTIVSPEQNSPSVIAGPIGKLLPLAHAQTGHRPRGVLVIHVLHAASGHLSLRHEGLTASRHCGVAHNRQNEALSKPKGPNIPSSSFLLSSMWQTTTRMKARQGWSQDGPPLPSPHVHTSHEPLV